MRRRHKDNDATNAASASEIWADEFKNGGVNEREFLIAGLSRWSVGLGLSAIETAETIANAAQQGAHTPGITTDQAERLAAIGAVADLGSDPSAADLYAFKGSIGMSKGGEAPF